MRQAWSSIKDDSILNNLKKKKKKNYVENLKIYVGVT